MQLPEAYTLSERLIKTQETHQDYARVTELERDYKIYKTGKGIASKLIQFVVREDGAMFAQRMRMTKTITPAVTGSVEKPFNKVSRNDRIRKGMNLSDPGRVSIVEKMQQRFFGAARRQNRGLDAWLKTRFPELSFIDPNAWIVVEWDAVEANKVITPRPFEVKACEAVNFYIENEEVHWLFVKQPISYKAKNQVLIPGNARTLGMPDLIIDPHNGPKVEFCQRSGFRYTLYDEDYTIVLMEVDKDALLLDNVVIDPSYQELVKIGESFFVRSWYEPKIGYVPAFRVGYRRDLVTDGRTFVNPWDESMCYIEKTLKTVSEMDLTMSLHVFPQKLQYVQACTGKSKAKKCNGGYLNDGTMCGVCNGTGYKVHTTAQDAILLPMPENPVSADMVDLEKLLVYKAPPIETVKFQNEYILQLERQVHQAVYNSQVFIKKQTSSTSSGGGGGDVVQTATENDNNMQSVYDTLEPYTEKYSEMYIDLTTTFAILAGETDIDKIQITHIFPSDYKLKTSDILLSERKAAKDSGAPPFLMETIDDDLATIIYAGDPLSMQKYRVMRQFFPFSGKSPDEIALAIASTFVPEETKVLYMNFETIFKEIELAHPEFWVMKSVEKQKQLVDEQVKLIMDELNESNPSFNMDAFRSAAPRGATIEGGDQTPGDENPADQNTGAPDTVLNPQA